MAAFEHRTSVTPFGARELRACASLVRPFGSEPTLEPVVVSDPIHRDSADDDQTRDEDGVVTNREQGAGREPVPDEVVQERGELREPPESPEEAAEHHGDLATSAIALLAGEHQLGRFSPRHLLSGHRLKWCLCGHLNHLLSFSLE